MHRFHLNGDTPQPTSAVFLPKFDQEKTNGNTLPASSAGAKNRSHRGRNYDPMGTGSMRKGKATREVTIEQETRVLHKLSQNLTITEGTTTLNYPLKLPEARFKFMELHTMLDEMVMDMRRDPRNNEPYRKITSAPGGDAGAAVDNVYTAPSDTDVKATESETATDSTKDKDAISKSSAPPKPQFDPVLSDLAKQAVEKTKHIKKCYRQHMENTERSFYERNQAQHERWKENVQELKQYEAERQELLGRIERLSKMTAAKKDQMTAHRHIKYHAEEHGQALEDIEELQELREEQDELEQLESAQTIESVVEWLSDSCSGALDGLPHVCQLLARQLQEERKLTRLKVFEMSNEMRSMQKRLYGLRHSNSKLEKSIEASDQHIEVLQYKLQNKAQIAKSLFSPPMPMKRVKQTFESI